ncbi:DUF2061 domain-containing protein [Phenylobacterium soli]|uniref:DUF2061 domain-containing protein n=1 Tax=Phenylobacterium soli TaxID=2170551 RepID=A0A328AJW7_9CAUL|nr:DUF2061 domain-containing protein [Phenylobacterium soli]RAK54705.1 DUF2061 domain-containing protein [Phenylobacterium soli]
MFLRAPEAHSRSFVKAVSWRVLGSIDTFVISYFITGKLVFAASIASVETFTKIMLFYFHEQAWARVRWGRSDQVLAAEDAKSETAHAPAATPAASAEQAGALVVEPA